MSAQPIFRKPSSATPNWFDLHMEWERPRFPHVLRRHRWRRSHERIAKLEQDVGLIRDWPSFPWWDNFGDF